MPPSSTLAIASRSDGRVASWLEARCAPKKPKACPGTWLAWPQDARQSATLVFWPTPMTMMTTPLPSTIAEAADWLHGGRLSSVELTRRLLSDAQAAQDSVGAFVTFTEESALAAAQKADDELSRGNDRGPLQGVPLGIKDIL